MKQKNDLMFIFILLCYNYFLGVYFIMFKINFVISILLISLNGAMLIVMYNEIIKYDKRVSEYLDKLEKYKK